MQAITSAHRLVFSTTMDSGHPDARRRCRSRDVHGTRGARRHGRALPSEALTRLLVSEGRGGSARHAARDRARRPRLRARHARPLPRDVRRLAEGRAALRDPGRGVRGPIARAPGRDPRRRRSGRRTRPSVARSARSAHSVMRSPDSTDGSQGCGASSRRRARIPRSSAGTSATSCGRQTRSPIGRKPPSMRTSTERGLPVNALHAQRLRVDRVHALHGAGHRP